MQKYLVIISLLLSATVHAQSDLVVDLQPNYTAGDPITLVCRGSTALPDRMIAIYAYGVESIHGQLEASQVSFQLPSQISQVAGRIKIKLLNKQEIVWQGETSVLVDQSSESSIEAYCGPKHLIVDKMDFAMITASLLDKYDNPYPDSTALNVQYMQGEHVTTFVTQMQDLVAFQRVYAPQKTGIGSVSIMNGQIGSKEFRLSYYANDPINYSLLIEREHRYADGNQLVHLKTTPIQDSTKNTVENGTAVYFYINDPNGNLNAQLIGQTISGVAQVNLPAPLEATTWTIHSSIPGYATSQNTQLHFEQAIKTLPVTHNERGIIVGPVLSYMGQQVKDGIVIKLIIKGEKYYYASSNPIKSGYAEFGWPLDMKTGKYSIEVSLNKTRNIIEITR
ncbi:hypothetical protein N6H18_17280 [Reichenbachiella agarivorans]|uniref:Uncharacterized protein n=1 Tax=Reichenbachiella agarivorans TaxID=2979464 RepID=A0ABY6CRV8_9BACT|nr:hypothetical protein [Reichenbachiella agarivorans]UXP32098.1 hypothetical protein N6H18_17280 [Reichenbachiella agarivorans]